MTNEAEQSRLRADYDASFVATEAEAQEQIERARLFLYTANEYFN